MDKEKRKQIKKLANDFADKIFNELDNIAGIQDKNRELIHDAKGQENEIDNGQDNN